jgi:hypothetical protein
MADFNLQTLYDFRPARLFCEKCLALLVGAPSAKYPENPRCPVCDVQYEPTEEYSRNRADAYLRNQGLSIEIENLLEHCTGLAEAMQTRNVFGKAIPPLYLLLATVSRAKKFVHFTSFGISEFFMGALKLKAHTIQVRGIVSNVDERTLDEITSLKDDVPSGQLEIQHYLRNEAWEEAPHQKLIVIDGLVAFKGSANLTLPGWRKAAKGRDHVEPVTNVNEVIGLHNKLFSPVWASRSKCGDSIKMTTQLPF